MKSKKCNWLLKICYVTDDNKYVVTYVNVLDSTKKEVMNTVDEYRKKSIIVYVYKLESLF